MNENEPDEDRYWEHGWDGHELAQLRRMVRLPLSEKLEWLEEAHRLVEQLSQQRQACPTEAKQAPSPNDE